MTGDESESSVIRVVFRLFLSRGEKMRFLRCMGNFPPRSLRKTTKYLPVLSINRNSESEFFFQTHRARSIRLHGKAFLLPPTSPTTDAVHAIFFSQTHDILCDEPTVNIVRIDPQGEVGPR